MQNNSTAPYNTLHNETKETNQHNIIPFYKFSTQGFVEGETLRYIIGNPIILFLLATSSKHPENAENNQLESIAYIMFIFVIWTIAKTIFLFLQLGNGNESLEEIYLSTSIVPDERQAGITGEYYSCHINNVIYRFTQNQANYDWQCTRIDPKEFSWNAIPLDDIPELNHLLPRNEQLNVETIFNSNTIKMLLTLHEIGYHPLHIKEAPWLLYFHGLRAALELSAGIVILSSSDTASIGLKLTSIASTTFTISYFLEQTKFGRTLIRDSQAIADHFIEIYLSNTKNDNNHEEEMLENVVMDNEDSPAYFNNAQEYLISTFNFLFSKDIVRNILVAVPALLVESDAAIASENIGEHMLLIQSIFACYGLSYFLKKFIDYNRKNYLYIEPYLSTDLDGFLLLAGIAVACISFAHLNKNKLSIDFIMSLCAGSTLLWTLMIAVTKLSQQNTTLTKKSGQYKWFHLNYNACIIGFMLISIFRPALQLFLVKSNLAHLPHENSDSFLFRNIMVAICSGAWGLLTYISNPTCETTQLLILLSGMLSLTGAALMLTSNRLPSPGLLLDATSIIVSLLVSMKLHSKRTSIINLSFFKKPQRIFDREAANIFSMFIHPIGLLCMILLQANSTSIACLEIANFIFGGGINLLKETSAYIFNKHTLPVINNDPSLILVRMTSIISLCAAINILFPSQSTQLAYGNVAAAILATSIARLTHFLDGPTQEETSPDEEYAVISTPRQQSLN